MKSWKAELALFLVTFIWGGTFLFTKLGLEYTQPSFYIILRFSIALLLSIIIFRKSILKIPKSVAKEGFILGVFFGAGFLFQTYGLDYTTVSKSAFITGITVPLTPFVFWFIVRKKVQKWSKIGVIIASIGLWLFTNPTFDGFNIGDLLTLLSTVFWALYITYMDVYTKGKSGKDYSAQLVIMQFVGATPLAIISFIILDLSSFQFELNGALIGSLAFNSILASILVTFIHTSVQRYTTPVKAALIFSLEPVVASSVAMIFLSEFLNFREYVGAAILFSGVLISELGPYVFKKRLTPQAD